MAVEKHFVNAFVDSGAVSVSVLSERLYREIPSLKCKSLKPILKSSFLSVMGEPLDVLGYVDVDMTIDNVPIQMYVHLGLLVEKIPSEMEVAPL